ncbi:hypothetical protein H4Q26_013639 [Puccinia striiformis f. sp. tritici PST-130]|nr:hypothetical protein H4Q26_013639 [Puccinia striiformis f. sp. tritici PST-130]
MPTQDFTPLTALYTAMDNIQLTASSAAMDNNQTNSASASAVLPREYSRKPGQHDVMSLAHLIGPSSTAGDDALDDEDKGTDLDPDARAKHDAFVRARKGHYENEAEAMKKTRKLAEKDDIESDVAATSVEESEDLPSLPSSESQPNGA